MGLVLVASAAFPASGVAAPAAPARDDVLGEIKTVAAVRFEGRRHVRARELQSVLKTHPPSIWPWHDRPVLRPDFLRSDTVAIRDRYRLHGFLDARDTVLVASLRDSSRVAVTFRIHEGGQSKVAAVEFDGVRSYPEDQLRRKLLTRRGQPFDPYVLGLDTLKISELYQDRGYRPRVVVTARRGAGNDSLRVWVRYEVEEGSQYRVGEINVHTSDFPVRVDSTLIRRELLLKPGQIYRRTFMVRTWERLYDTGLFSQVQITPLVNADSALIGFDIALRERRPRWIDAGVGSGTAERYRGTIEWGHRNLMGRGIQGALSSRLAFDGQGRFLLSHTEVSILQPWMFGTRTRGQVTPFFERSDDRADPRWLVQQDARGVKFELRRDISRFSYLSLAQDNVWAHQSFTALDTIPAAEFDTLVRAYSTHSLALGGQWDFRDNPLNASQGSVHALTGELAGGLLRGTSSFRKLTASSAWYVPRTNGWVLALRLRAGAIEPVGLSRAFSSESEVDSVVARVPLGDRFRVGGVNSIRGYNENAIPPSGGLAMFQANAELRIQLIGPFGLEMYVDAGNVWARPTYLKLSQFTPRYSHVPMDPNDVRYVVGFGPRLNLPIGPIRFDLTWSLRPTPNAQGGATWLRAKPQFAIGPSF